MKTYTFRITTLPVNIHNPFRKGSLSPALWAVKEQETSRFLSCTAKFSPSSLSRESSGSVQCGSQCAHTVGWSWPAGCQVQIPGLPGESGVLTSWQWPWQRQDKHVWLFCYKNKCEHINDTTDNRQVTPFLSLLLLLATDMLYSPYNTQKKMCYWSMKHNNFLNF